jgi:hypothetical protein
MLRSLLRCVGVAALMFLAFGCNEGPSTVRVTGTARHRGKPVANLFLNFVPDEGRASWGVTDENGHFKLFYDRTREGAVRGKHKVHVSYRARTPSDDLALEEGRLKLPADMQAILDKYGDPATSTLQYNITKDGQEIDLDLD